jgi:hypothetical protein
MWVGVDSSFFLLGGMPSAPLAGVPERPDRIVQAPLVLPRWC